MLHFLYENYVFLKKKNNLFLLLLTLKYIYIFGSGVIRLRKQYP